MQQITRVFFSAGFAGKIIWFRHIASRIFEAFPGTLPFCAQSKVAPWNTWVASVGFSQQAAHWRWAGAAKRQDEERPFSFSGSWTSVHRGIIRGRGWGDWLKLDIADKNDVSCAGFATWRELCTCSELVVSFRPHCWQHQCGSCLEPRWNSG